MQMHREDARGSACPMFDGASSALEARQKENEAARQNEQDAEPAHWCFLDPQGAVQGPYHRLQMRFWFEKGFFEMKTPVRFGLSGPFTMLGDAFGAAAAGEYVWAFLDDAAIAKKRDQAEELKNRPTQNPHGTWKQKHLKVPATRENPFPNEDFESPGQELYWCAHAGETRAALKLVEEGADVLWRNHNEQCILSAAAKAGDVEIIRALVKCGAPPSHENIWHMTRAAQESEIPNFKGSDLGHFPLVSADFWTSDHLSERSRSVNAFPGTRARGTLTLKRR